MNKAIIKPKERRYMKVEVPFLNKISELGKIKLVMLNIYDTLGMKANF